MELEAGGEKCSALCQHPGCWYSGSRLKEVSKWPPPRYTHYLAEVATHRTLCRTPDSHIRSYTVDGLPTLKVQSLTQEQNVLTRSNTSPAPLQRIKSKHARTTDKPLTFPKVTYAQILLEEGDDECFEMQDEIVLKRVLIWRPGLRKRSHESPARTAVHEPGRSLPETLYGSKRQADGKMGGSVASRGEHSGLIGSMKPSSIGVRTEKKSSVADKSSSTAVRPDRSTVRDDNQTTDQQNRTPHETSKSSLQVYQTNHAETRPPYSERHKPKTSTSLQQWNLKRFSSPDAVSLSYLGDINLPPQIVEEILQQLRSESTSNTDIDFHVQSLSQTPALNNQLSSKPSQESKPSSLRQSYTVSDHQKCDLFRNRVLNVSGSGLSAAAQRKFSHVSSFSRGLSIHPLDALKVHTSNQRTKVSDQLCNVAEHKSNWWRELGDDNPGQIGMDTVNPSTHAALQKHRLIPLGLHASGHTSYLHTRSSQFGGQSCLIPHSENSQQPSRKSANDNWVAKDTDNIIIPVETTDVTTKSPRTITLNFDPVSKHHAPSHRHKDSKVASRFVSVPKSRYSPKCSQPQSAYTEDDLISGSYTPLFARGQTSRLSSSQSAAQKHPVLQRLMCPSPDYMMVAAKFTEGQLILTDREGLVTQHLSTEVESDTESSESSKVKDESEKAAGPPSNVEPMRAEAVSSVEPVSSRLEEEEEKRKLSNVLAGSRAPPTSAMEEMRRNC